MMRLPTIYGLIRRRILANYRVDPVVMAGYLPAPFRPKLHNGHAIAGICLIRLERIRPSWMPPYLGISSENAAHRIAVVWDDASGRQREGVFIPRRDTSSLLNHFGGGRIFPGEHQLADFSVSDVDSKIGISIRSRDGTMAIELKAHETDNLPEPSCFQSLADSSAYFEGGRIGYSVTRDCCRLDGIRLETEHWQVNPLAIDHLESTFFADEEKFPAGSVVLDHALIMRNHPHKWHMEPDIHLEG